MRILLFIESFFLCKFLLSTKAELKIDQSWLELCRTIVCISYLWTIEEFLFFFCLLFFEYLQMKRTSLKEGFGFYGAFDFLTEIR